MNFTTDYGDLTPQQMKAFRYMWAHCLLSSERYAEAIAIFHELSRQGDHRAYEGLLDAYSEKLRSTISGGYRNHLVRTAKPMFRRFLADLLDQPAKAHYLDRFVWKLARFFEREAPGELWSVFQMLDGVGYWMRNAADPTGSHFRARTAALRRSSPR
jgi:hypothetical protein